MRFRAKTIEQHVEDSICRSRDLENPWHGITPDSAIDNLVKPPVSRRFYDNFDSSSYHRLVWLWEVWDECPGSQKGYLIVYDPRKGSYGLATKPDHTRKYGLFIGFYGSEFSDALISL